MSDFEFPTNIKQIGSIGDGLRIYIEDYAYTYLQQYAEAGGYEERIALLIGRTMVIDGNKVLFISGAIQGVHTKQDKGMTMFSEESMSYAYEQMQNYFRGLEIVGWMQSQPSYGVLLNSGYTEYHAETFVKPDQVLFIVDPIESLNAFYIWNTTKEDLEETRGYFIYYDKNHGMQEYMLANRAREKPKSTFRLMTRATEFVETDAEPAEPEKARFIKPKDADDIEPRPVERRVTNLLVSLSAVLVLVCFIMGAGLIQNEGRISNLEDQLVLLTTAYRDLMSQREDRTVFAAQIGSELQSLTDEATPAPTPTLVSPTPEPTPEPMPEPLPASTPEPTPEPVAIETPQQVQAPPPTALLPETYTVEIGDSLIFISRKFYGDGSMVSRIMELNGIDDPDKLYYGTKIKLPRD